MRTKLQELNDKRTDLFYDLNLCEKNEIEKAEQILFLANEEREYILEEIMEIETQIAEEKS